MAHVGFCYGLAFSPDGRVLATGASARVRLWDLQAKKELLARPGHESRIEALAFRADGSLLATTAVEGVGRLWDPISGTEVRTLAWEGAYPRAAFSADGQYLALGGEGGILGLWEVATGRRLRELRRSALSNLHALAWRPDGRVLAAGYRDGVVSLWEPGAGKELRFWMAHGTGGYGVLQAAFSPDGKQLFTGRDDGQVRGWDPDSGKEIRPVRKNEGSIRTLAVSPDGRFLAFSGLSARSVPLWDLAAGKESPALAVPQGVGSLAFRPDSGALAASAADGSMRLWDLATGKESGVLRVGPSLEGWGRLAFSPEGRHLVLGAGNGVVLVLRQAPAP